METKLIYEAHVTYEINKLRTQHRHNNGYEGMAVNCTLTFQYKILSLIQLGQVGSLTTATPLSRKR